MPLKRASVKNKNSVSAPNFFGKLETEIQSNQSRVSMILGALIILVAGILVFNYFNRNKAALGPAQQTTIARQESDASPDQLPGKYTVKEGDTLFTIAQNYYNDGFKFSEIVKTNNLANSDEITTGQVLQIPKLETEKENTSAETEAQGTGTGGGNSTIWGDKIEGDKYTVVENDWLSKIAGRAYGDVMSYEKIAKANNISNPDHIEPGQILIIPR